MTAKRALIVDDSKSARTFLSKILEKYAIDVETAESAELAIEHLATHSPDVIFMDHLMPGMDGFQAVQLIKNNPRTATIPIMMYTSQEGELYLGQARALGAVGVLPKQIRPADVSKVLYQLKLVPDRRNEEQETFQPIEGSLPAVEASEAELPGAVGGQGGPLAANDAEAGAAQSTLPPAPSAPVALPGVLQAVEAAVHSQLVELRQFVTMTLDDHSARTASEVRALLQDLPRTAAPLRPTPRGSIWPWLLASLGALAAVAFGVLWYRENLARQTAEARLAQNVAAAAAAAAVVAQAAAAAPAAAQPGAPAGTANPDVAADAATAPPSDSGPSSTRPGTAAGTGPGTGAVAAPPVAAPSAPRSAATAGASSRLMTEPVPYGEAPLSGGRIEALRAALSRAVAQGFHGVVEIRTFGGRYCLSGNASDGYSLAPEDLPLAKCDLLGNPRDDGPDPGQRESLDFANFLGAFRQSTSNAVDVKVVNGDAGSLVMPYPSTAERTTAGEWNRAAAANNRIEVLLHPGA